MTEPRFNEAVAHAEAAVRSDELLRGAMEWLSEAELRMILAHAVMAGINTALRAVDLAFTPPRTPDDPAPH